MPTPDHDGLFKATFADPVDVVRYLAEVVGGPLLQRADPQAARLVPVRLSDAPRALHADVVVEVPQPGGGARLLALLEHTSSPRRRLPLQVAGYAVRLMEQDAPSGPFPPVVAVVIHQGVTPYRGPRTLHDALTWPRDARALAPHVPDVALRIIDLIGDPSTITGPPAMRAGLGLLRAARQPDPIARVAQIGALLPALHEAIAQRGRAFLEPWAGYFTTIQPEGVAFPPTAAADAAALEDTVRTLAQRWYEDGLQEGQLVGRQEGRQEGRIEGQQEGRLMELRALLRDLLPADASPALRARAASDDPDALHALLRELVAPRR